MAKEATIQQIDTITAIPKADFLELATIKGLGWTFVVRKGAFKPGDPCVYFMIDSELPPDAPWAKFLADKGSTRIKTMRFRGALSQGLALEIDILVGTSINGCTVTKAEIFENQVCLYTDSNVYYHLHFGENVTDILGVKHYEKPIPEGMSGNPKGSFPGHTPKTDETMLQNIPEILKEMEGQEIYVTVKCDGTSSTYSKVDGELDVCGRNWSMNEWSRENDPDGKPPIHNLYWKMYRKYNIGDVLDKIPNISIQAEMIGPGIQGNKLGLNDVEIRVFNVWDVKNAKYYDFDELCAFCAAHKLPMVPIIYFDGKPTTIMSGEKLTMGYWLEKAKGLYEGTKNRREGIVTRTCKSQYLDGVQNRASFKALNNDFLLKDEK